MQAFFPYEGHFGSNILAFFPTYNERQSDEYKHTLNYSIAQREIAEWGRVLRLTLTVFSYWFISCLVIKSRKSYKETCNSGIQCVTHLNNCFTYDAKDNSHREKHLSGRDGNLFLNLSNFCNQKQRNTRRLNICTFTKINYINNNTEFSK